MRGARRASLLPVVILVVAACGGGQSHLPASGSITPTAGASAGTSAAPSATVAPTATPLDANQLPGRYLLAGDVALDLVPDGDAFIVRDADDVARGSWSATGNVLVFTGSPCEGVSGTYRWSLDTGLLTLRRISDTCGPRSAVLAQPFDKALERLPWATTAASATLAQPGYGYAAVDAKGNFWETDGASGFYRYAPDGTLAASFAGLAQSAGITVDKQGRVSVADAAKGAVRRYDATGKLVATWTVDGGIVGPAGLAHDAAGNLYVALRGDHDHFGEKYSTAGKRLLSWAPDGSGLGQIGGGPNAGPGSISVDAAGDILLTDPVNNRLVRYDRTGGFAGNILGGDRRSLNAPSVAAVDSTGGAFALVDNEIWEWDSGGTFVGAWLIPYSGDLVVDAGDHLWCVGSRIVAITLTAP